MLGWRLTADDREILVELDVSLRDDLGEFDEYRPANLQALRAVS